MSKMPLKDIVMKMENGQPRIGYPGYDAKYADFVVGTLLTNAIFDQDIYAIQTIIGRIDGGVPKDVDLASYQTEFGDCLSEILALDSPAMAKIYPEDTVMEALCKSLVDLAGTDIFTKFENVRNEDGTVIRRVPTGKKKPSAQEKKEHDAALRMVLERTGGRKTTPIKPIEEDKIELAPWIMAALPQGEEDE